MTDETPRNLKQRLELACGREVIIRLRSDSEEVFDGFVCAVGDHWVLLANVSDAIMLDGYTALRLDLVAEYEDEAQFEYGLFHLQALRLRGQLPLGEPPVIDLTSAETIIGSASVVAPLVTVHPDEHPGECYIGREPHIEDGVLRLEEIDPAGNWSADDDAFPIDQIRRIDFGGLYEDALWRVAQARAEKQTHSRGGRPGRRPEK